VLTKTQLLLFLFVSQSRSEFRQKGLWTAFCLGTNVATGKRKHERCPLCSIKETELSCYPGKRKETEGVAFSLTPIASSLTIDLKKLSIRGMLQDNSVTYKVIRVPPDYTKNKIMHTTIESNEQALQYSDLIDELETKIPTLVNVTLNKVYHDKSHYYFQIASIRMTNKPITSILTSLPSKWNSDTRKEFKAFRDIHTSETMRHEYLSRYDYLVDQGKIKGRQR